MGRQSYLIALGGNRWGKWGTPTGGLHALLVRDDSRRHAALRFSAPPREPTSFSFTRRRGEAEKGEETGWTAVASDLIATSSIHTTAPLGPGTRCFANAIALIESDLDPPALLARLKEVERAYGRRPGRRWGDRPLDLDIIGWSGGIWASRTLSIPHPAFRARRFVLAPLVEVAPDWRDPVTGLTARHLLARLDRKRPRA